MTAKKTAAKKPAAKKATAPKSDDALAVVRADTPDPELTDLDRDPESVCRYCGRDAVTEGLCEKHAARRGVES